MNLPIGTTMTASSQMFDALLDSFVLWDGDVYNHHVQHFHEIAMLFSEQINVVAQRAIAPYVAALENHTLRINKDIDVIDDLMGIRRRSKNHELTTGDYFLLIQRVKEGLSISV